MNLSRERNPLLVNNITVAEINRCSHLRSQLANLGIVSYYKVTRNAKESTGIVKIFKKTKEQRLKLLEIGEKIIKTFKFDYELIFKPLLRQPLRCQYCNILSMYHSDVTCTPSQRCCSKCRSQDHLSNSAKPTSLNTTASISTNGATVRLINLDAKY